VIEPPLRNPGTRFFDETRLREILRAFAADFPLPPIEVFASSVHPYRYRLHNGIHRFYASAAVGFPRIPVRFVAPPFHFETAQIPA
jgi:hypothetical protein